MKRWKLNNETHKIIFWMIFCFIECKIRRHCPATCLQRCVNKCTTKQTNWKISSYWVGKGGSPRAYIGRECSEFFQVPKLIQRARSQNFSKSQRPHSRGCSLIFSTYFSHIPSYFLYIFSIFPCITPLYFSHIPPYFPHIFS